MAHRIVQIRGQLRLYRRWAVGLGAALLACFALVGFLLVADGEDSRVLGRGVAGVQGGSPGAADAALGVDLPDDLAPPEAPAEPVAEDTVPTEEPVPGEQLVRRALGQGAASYYHDALEGRPTASGEPYQRSALTAAHRTLPFGSRVRVTNLVNGRSVVARVNDRGPFADQRVIDLSRAAARQIGLIARGHGRVRLELVE